MKLKIWREQEEVKGLLGGSKGITFKLTAQVQISDEERALIKKYGLDADDIATYPTKTSGGGTIKAVITLNHLINGAEMTGDFYSMVNREADIKEGCSDFISVLRAMSAFGGHEEFEFD